eukprot:6199495-Pleurochrysis_carterae.AAC.1
MLAASDACGLCAPLASTPTHVARAYRPIPGVRRAPHPRNAYTRACSRIMRHQPHTHPGRAARATRACRSAPRTHAWPVRNRPCQWQTTGAKSAHSRTCTGGVHSFAQTPSAASSECTTRSPPRPSGSALRACTSSQPPQSHPR